MKKQCLSLRQILVTACVISITTVALAATWVVDQAGGGDFTAIQPAVNAASPGDTVLIQPGRYLEYAPYDFGAVTADVHVVVETPQLTIRGSSPQDVIIGPTSYDWPLNYSPNGIAVVSGVTDCVVENVTVENIPIGIYSDQGLTIRNSYIRGCRQGASLWAPDKVLIEYSSFESCQSFGLAIWSQAPKSIVRDCRFADVTSHFIVSTTDSLSVEGCVFLADATISFQNGASGHVSNCQFTPGGVVAQDGTALWLERNQFDAGNYPSLSIYWARMDARRNVVECDQSPAIAIGGNSEVFFRENHLLNHNSFPAQPLVTVSYPGAPPGFTADFQGNWWGTTDTWYIDRWIEDYLDEPSRGITVEYQPLLQAPVSTQAESIGGFKALFGGRRD